MMVAPRLTSAQVQALIDQGREDLVRRWWASLSPLDRFIPRPDDAEEFDEQSGFVASDAKFSICLGGNGSGKTSAAAVKTARYVLDTPPHRENCPFWILGETFEQTCATCWDEKLCELIPRSRILAIDWHNVKRNWPRGVILRHPDNPSRPGWVLEFKSYDQGVFLMQGRSIGGYWFNEEAPLEIVHEVQVRCRDYDSPGWADFTPIHIRDPRWSDLYDDPPEGWKFFHLNTWKNKAKKVQEWAKTYFESIPQDERATRERGVFASFTGQVFKEFRKSLHVIDPETTEDPLLRKIAASLWEGVVPGNWKRVRGIDFGWSNPTVCLWIARDTDGRWYVYDEHYEAQQPIEYHAERIKERGWNYNHPMFGRTYCDSEDPAAINKLRVLTDSKSFVPVNKSLATIGRQISVVRSQMMVQGDGRPKLYILSKCKNLIREIRGYRWSEPVGREKNKRNPQDYPVQWDDHTVDALRYAIYHEMMAPVGPPMAVRREPRQRESVRVNTALRQRA